MLIIGGSEGEAVFVHFDERRATYAIFDVDVDRRRAELFDARIGRREPLRTPVSIRPHDNFIVIKRSGSFFEFFKIKPNITIESSVGNFSRLAPGIAKST